MQEQKNTEKLLQLIEAGTSPFHTVAKVIRDLEEAGFTELDLSEKWGLGQGGKYYMPYNGTSLIAFCIGKDLGFVDELRIAAAHTDFPCLRIKPNPEITSEKYCRLNVEIYGGAILNTWLDRPLSVAGRVVVKSDDVFSPKVLMIDLKKPLLIIPNVAIHLNKEVNKGVELNRQTDMLPIAGLIPDNMIAEELNKEHYFIKYLAQALNVEAEDILDFELSIYNTEAGNILGMRNEFISAPRLDNLTSVQALVSGMIEGSRKKGMNVIALFDHEEVGSRTKQGAGSMLLNMVLEKIFLSLGRNRLDYIESLAKSMLLSVDVAHGLHPSQPLKNDPTNKCILGGGICIKEASAQTYATDSVAVGIIQQLCDFKKIPYQKYVNRSDGTFGSTLGSIASTLIAVKTIDIGVPILAMHSSRELMGREDQDSLVELMKAYFSL